MNNFIINDEKYTVGDIQKLIEKHPLVFRKDQISKNDFPMHLKYAIADLIRDEKITFITYIEKYDEKPHIKKDVSILKDAIMFKLHLKTYLEGKNISNDDFNKNYENVINDHLNKYYENLIEKYNNEIKINYDLLEQIKITGIDLYAYKKGYPYPFVVPDFPIITNKFELNFGVDINIPNKMNYNFKNIKKLYFFIILLISNTYIFYPLSFQIDMQIFFTK